MATALTQTQVAQGSQSDDLRLPSPGEFFLGLIVGVVFLVFTFPLGVTKLGTTLGWSWVHDTGAAATTAFDGFFGASPGERMSSFQTLWLAVLIGLAAYLGTLLVLSLRHVRFDLFGLGLLFLVIGAAFLHLLAWVVYILFIAGRWVLQVLAFLLGKLGDLLRVIFQWFGWLFGVIFGFLFGSGWWLLALLAGVVVVALAMKYRMAFFKVVLWLLVITGVGYLLVKLSQFLWPYIKPILEAIGRFFAPIVAFIQGVLAAIGRFLAPIIAFIGRLLVYIFIGFLVGCVIYGCGALIIDQIKGAWDAGSEKRGVMLGALSIGTSIAIVLLASNLGNNAQFFPADLPRFVADNIHQASPIFNVLITLLVIAVSIVGVLRNLPKLHPGPGLGRFKVQLAILAPLVVLLGVLALLVAHDTGDSSS